MNFDLYDKVDLLTYNEIEEDRITNKKYVIYDFNKTDDRLPDKYDPSMRWCSYMIESPTGEETRSRKSVILEKYKAADLYSENMDTKYAELTSLLTDCGLEHAIPYFCMCCTLNVKECDLCQLMIIAGGSINYDLLISDIQAAINSKSPLSRIFRRLYAQVCAAALNGIYTNWFCATLNRTINDGTTLDEIDKLPSHKRILEHYQKNVLCDRSNPKAILIPNDHIAANPFTKTRKLIFESDKKESLDLSLFFVETKKAIEGEGNNFRRAMLDKANNYWYGKRKDGTPFPADKEYAIYCYKLAASSGAPELRLECGLRLLDHGKTKEAISYLSSVSTRSGDVGKAARYSLVKAYYNLKSYEKMHEFISKSIEDGSDGAYYYLGESYYNGLGVKENKKSAIKYYRAGIEKGDARCKMMFVAMCVMEFGSKDDARLAIKILSENKELNDRQNYELGLLYFRLKDYYPAFSAFSKIPYKSSSLSKEELEEKAKLKKISFKKSGI